MPRTNVPSAKRIQEAFACDTMQARKVWAALRYAQDAITGGWRGDKAITDALDQASDILFGHGVEILRSNQDTCCLFRGICYVNFGDPYQTTIMFDFGERRFRIGSCGDCIEGEPKRFDDNQE